MAHHVLRAVAVAGAVAATVAQCIPYRGQPNPLVSAPNDYAGALVFAATGAAAAAGHRAATGGCYAQCANGYTCNPRSGFCEKRPTCPTELAKVEDPACLDGKASAAPTDLTPPSGEPEDMTTEPDADAGVSSLTSAPPAAARIPFRVE